MRAITQRRLWIGTLGAVAFTFVFVVFNPLAWPIFPRCMFHAITGLNCPGCGTTRAFAELAHCHVLTALRFNSLTVLMLPVLGVLWVTGQLERAKPVWIWTMLAVLITFAVVRNLPWYPWTLLSPP